MRTHCQKIPHGFRLNIFTLGGSVLLLIASLANGQIDPDLRVRDDLLLEIVGLDAEEEYALSGSKNLARRHLGSGILSAVNVTDISFILSEGNEDLNRDPSALISEDETLGFDLPAGKSEFVISLANSYVLERFSFYNRGVVGTVKVLTSPFSVSKPGGEWHDAGGPAACEGFGPINLDLNFAQGRSVKIVFNATQAGRMNAFCLFGDLDLSELQFGDPRFVNGPLPNYTPEVVVGPDLSPDLVGLIDPINYDLTPSDMINYNVSGLYAGARVIAVSSGLPDESPYAMDDDIKTFHAFNPQDPTPAILTDLNCMRRIRRVSVMTGTTPGVMMIYSYRDLPGEMDDDAREILEKNKTSLRTPEDLRKTSTFETTAKPKKRSGPAYIRIRKEKIWESEALSSVRVRQGYPLAAVDFDERDARYILYVFFPDSYWQTGRGALQADAESDRQLRLRLLSALDGNLFAAKTPLPLVLVDWVLPGEESFRMFDTNAFGDYLPPGLTDPDAPLEGPDPPPTPSTRPFFKSLSMVPIIPQLPPIDPGIPPPPPSVSP